MISGSWYDIWIYTSTSILAITGVTVVVRILWLSYMYLRYFVTPKTCLWLYSAVHISLRNFTNSSVTTIHTRANNNDAMFHCSTSPVPDRYVLSKPLITCNPVRWRLRHNGRTEVNAFRQPWRLSNLRRVIVNPY